MSDEIKKTDLDILDQVNGGTGEITSGTIICPECGEEYPVSMKSAHFCSVKQMPRYGNPGPKVIHPG